MKKVYILSHIDADGLCSARIIASMEERAGNSVSVNFQKWYLFGVTKEDVKKMLDYDIIYVLDLGASQETLENLETLTAAGKEVWHIDHHPPDVDLNKYRSDKLRIMHFQDHCTASLAYEFYKANYEDVDDWSKIWTAVGIYGDVATSKLGASQVLLEIRESFPELTWNIARWTGRRESLIPVASHIGKYLNTARRVAFDYGAKKYGDYEILEVLFETEERENKILDVEFPHVAILKYWYRDWVKFRDEVFERTNIVNVETNDFYISFIEHPWDIGGYVAGVKSSKKPALCVNFGLKYADELGDVYCRLTARGSGNPPLNKVGEIAKELSGGKLYWNGHPEACGGAVHKDLSRKQIVKIVEEAFKAYRRGSL